MPATIVSFISEKGGVGKTTATYHIAIALKQWHQRRVLVVDADYQRGGITGRFFPAMLEQFRAGTMEGTTLFHCFQALYSAVNVTPRPDIRGAHRFHIDVMVSDPRLAGVSTDRLPGSNNIRENNRLLVRHLMLVSDVLREHAEAYDYILIDTHPETSDLMRSVICASDFAVSPVKLDEQSSVGVPSAIEAVNSVNADLASLAPMFPKARNYVPTQFVGSIGMMAREYAGDLKRTERSQRRTLAATVGGGMFESYITEGDGIRRAAEQREPVWSISGANADKQSDQFRELTEEFLRRCP